MKHPYLVLGSAILLTMAILSPSRADLRVGDEAQFFRSVDENLEDVDMSALIKGRPLVLVVGSCS